MWVFKKLIAFFGGSWSYEPQWVAFKVNEDEAHLNFASNPLWFIAP